MSNLPKYSTSIDEHAKTARQILGIGGDALVEDPVTAQDAPAPEEKTAAQAQAPVDINTVSDEDLIKKIAESEPGKVMLSNWDNYGRHLGALKFAEESKDAELVKSAESKLYDFFVEVLGEEGAVKAAEAHATGNALDAFIGE